jgi:adenylate cyclase
MAAKRSNEEFWRSALYGEMPGMALMKRFFKRIPSEPRCKLCLAPFGRPGNVFVRIIGAKPSALNRRICSMCIRGIQKHPGGAEVEVTALFADVRGSTGLAEHTSAGEFGQLLARFYGTAAPVVDRRDGIADKFVGDEAVALFIPGFSGKDHARCAVEAARDLMRETGNDGGDPWIRSVRPCIPARRMSGRSEKATPWTSPLSET